MSKKFTALLLVLLLGMLAAVAAAFFIAEPYEDTPEGRIYLGHGVDHPTYETMLAGGDGAARHGAILWAGLAFGLLQVAFFVALLAFGARKHGSTGPFRTPLAVGFVLFAAIFVAMFVSYGGYLQSDDPEQLFAFPYPTAWMIYGIWGFPLVFMFLYMLFFDRWTFTEEDAARFRELVAQKQAAADTEAP